MAEDRFDSLVVFGACVFIAVGFVGAYIVHLLHPHL